MISRIDRFGLARGAHFVLLAVGLSMSATGCGGAGGATSATDNQVLLNDPLSFDGTLSGKLVETQSTRASGQDAGVSQGIPPTFDTEDTVVRFKDLAGNDLLDPNGNPINEVPINPDGSFSVDNLPVGVDFTICGDIGKDGSCDIESCVSIPSTDGGDVGALAGVQAEPLTTLVLAKLRRAIEEGGIEPGDLPFSPATVVARIVGAYTHLFEETGIDESISLEDITNIARDKLAELFDTRVPTAARTGMEIAESNLAIAKARDADGLALGIAKVFLRAGFPIADGPDPPDLSALAELEGVEVTTPSELFGGAPFDGPPDDFSDEFGGDFLDGLPGDFIDGIPDEFADLTLEDIPDDLLDQIPSDFIDTLPDGLIDDFITIAQAQEPLDPNFVEDTIYINTFAEPDRNFAGGGAGDEFGEDGIPPLPIIQDFILLEMARFRAMGGRLTLGDLYDVLTSLDNGLGVRLTFEVFDPNFFGPPLTIFETADGTGKAINLAELFFRLFESGLHDLDADSFEARDAEFRQLLRDLLAGTVPPTFERLFGAFAGDRAGGIDELSRRIRESRAHLPFSRSGPSAFYVVADGDPFRTDAAVNAITVDAEVSIDGHVSAVTFNPTGDGKYYLGFTHGTEVEGVVELIVRETGRFLHGPRGPVRLPMSDESLFQPINGQPFFGAVSEHGTFYPGTSVTVIREEFVPQLEPDFFEFDPTLGSEIFDPTLDPEFIDPFLDPEFLDPEFTDPEFIDPFLDPEFTDPFIDPEFVDPVLDPIVETVDETQIIEVAEFDSGPNEQLFVLATGVGLGAEPVRVDYDPFTATATYNPAGRNLLMFLPDSEATGLFALFNEDTGRPAGHEDPTDFFQAPTELPDDFEQIFNDDFVDLPPPEDFFFEEELLPPPDGELLPPPDEEILPPPDEPLPPPDGGTIEPAQFVDDTGVDTTFEDPLADPFFDPNVDPGFDEFFDPGFILIAADQIIGLDLTRDTFTHVFGTEVPNVRYDPAGDPFFDDINGNGEHDAGEPTAQFRPTLFDAGDWRSTDLRLYYRRADNDGPISFDDVDFESPTPRTTTGVALTPRTYRARLNAFRFGRPNTAINLLTAFLPPNIFDGAHALNRDTEVDVFAAIAIINLVMDQVFNVNAFVDIDGSGPLPKEEIQVDARLFVAPIDDPFLMLLKGFRERVRSRLEP